ncbi:hypothetical protein EVAR_92544_1 [Eumeta japonica]|uniref:Uncharacterized protein n=1 Tax=Eumeta variegata TaxID=151549 RepID=A0A4C1SWC3_EUMVA|nr:hypothetical protein EVAR_92544_1 [Eumeta japonica]
MPIVSRSETEPEGWGQALNHPSAATAGAAHHICTLSLELNLTAAPHTDSDHALDSNFYPTLDFDRGFILDFHPGLDFQFHFSSCVCNFDSTAGHGFDLDKDVANAISIKIKFGVYYQGILRKIGAGRVLFALPATQSAPASSREHGQTANQFLLSTRNYLLRASQGTTDHRSVPELDTAP